MSATRPDGGPVHALAEAYARQEQERRIVRLCLRFLAYCLALGVGALVLGALIEPLQFLWLVIALGLLVGGIVLTLAALYGLVAGIRENRAYFGITAIAGVASAIVGAGASLLAALVVGGGGVAPWGRPLRIRGKRVHPDLVPGAGWAEGPTPRIDDLSPETREALARLWHHDAQKEHASVPAFSRIAWILAGLGAPAELLVDVHRCGLQEIDHARRCFALAGGYAGATLEASPMPELLRGELGLGRAPLVAIAVESLGDGCLIEDFNADVAEEALAAARDPAARELCRVIARDEREHADVAWKILAWCVAIGGEPVREAVRAAIDRLPTRGPIAYGAEDAAIVGAADPQALRDHGRVPAERWALIYRQRLARTRDRAYALIQPRSTRAA